VAKNAGKSDRVTTRLLARLALEEVTGNGWARRRDVVVGWLGRSQGAEEIDGAIRRGLVESRRARNGTRGPLAEYLRATPAGLRAWVDAVEAAR